MKYLSVKLTFLLMLLLVVLSGCSSDITISPGGTSAATTTASTSEPKWGVQTKTSDCQINGPIQDKGCTPGAIFPEATKEKICVPGYASSVRNVSTSLKNKVYASYGVKTRKPGQYEIDHLVSLQLGGSNDVANLWPEIDLPKPGFHEKDRVENWLHDQVCKGNMTLKNAQIKIATDWVAVYKTMTNPDSSSDQDSDGDGE
jgi:hypothetical protein